MCGVGGAAEPDSEVADLVAPLEEWFSVAVLIEGFFHATEYLWPAAGVRHCPASDIAALWATKLCRLLKGGLADEALAASNAPKLRATSQRPRQMRHEHLAPRSRDRGVVPTDGPQDPSPSTCEVQWHELVSGRHQPAALGSLRQLNGSLRHARQDQRSAA